MMRGNLNWAVGKNEKKLSDKTVICLERKCLSQALFTQ